MFKRILCGFTAVLILLFSCTSCNSNFSSILAGMFGMEDQTSSDDTGFIQGEHNSSSGQTVEIPSDAAPLDSNLSLPPDISDPHVALEGLTFRYDEAYLDLGATTRLRYTLMPENGDTGDLKWVSSAPEVISVSNKGKITANAGGMATITAYSEMYEVVSKCLIYVRGEAEAPEDVLIKGEDESESDFFTPPTVDDGNTTKPPVSSEKPVSSNPPVSSEKPVSSNPPVSSEKPVSSNPPVSSEKPVSSNPPVSSEKPVSSNSPVSSNLPVSSETSVSSGPSFPSGPNVNSKDDDSVYNFDNSRLLNGLIRVKQPDGSFVIANLLDFVVYHTGSELNRDFSDEAIRAQAVTVYTYYVCYNMSGGATYATSEHRKLNIDSTTGEVDFSRIYDQFPRYDGSYDRLRSLCASVLGQSVVYDGKPICAVFSAINRGASQCNSPYWSSYIFPYLVRVDSPWDMEASGYETTKVLTKAKVESALKETASGIKLPADPNEWFDEMERDIPDVGYILYVTIGDKSLKGSTLRTKLGLRSTCFFVQYDEDSETFTFTTHGYGHGIGMSQLGAQGMAEEGYSYGTIVKHYYQGTTLAYMEPALYEGSISENVSREEPVSSEKAILSEVPVSSETTSVDTPVSSGNGTVEPTPEESDTESVTHSPPSE